MRKIDILLNEYGESHQTKMNKNIHFVCVPLIFFSLIGLLASIPVPQTFTNISPSIVQPYVHLGTFVILLGLIYYYRLSKYLFMGMVLFSALVLLIIQLIAISFTTPLWLIMLCIFVIAWIGQFIGHNHEGKKPSFLKDLQFLMIGPAWTLSHLFEAFEAKF